MSHPISYDIVSDLDPYSDASILNPWPLYARWQRQGAAVWLSKYEMFALARYENVITTLQDATSFPSRFGVMMNDTMNQFLRGDTLCSDGEEHLSNRRILGRPLNSAVLASMEERLVAEANDLVDRLLKKSTFCATSELAAHLPLSVISHEVGFSEEGRSQMLEWADQLFNAFGPANERMKSSLPGLDAMTHYVTTHAVRGKVKPGSWADGLLDASDQGEIPPSSCPAMMINYIGASLDTTIYAISSGVWLFANHPEEWTKICEFPSLIPSAINEILRLEAPVQGFSRYVARDYQMDGTLLPAGSRVIAFYAAANRDPRKFPNPDRFDVMRNPTNQIAFGAGPHVCLGINLVRMEMKAIFGALAKRVKRFYVEEEERQINNTARGFKRLIVSIEKQ